MFAIVLIIIEILFYISLKFGAYCADICVIVDFSFLWSLDVFFLIYCGLCLLELGTFPWENSTPWNIRKKTWLCFTIWAELSLHLCLFPCIHCSLAFLTIPDSSTSIDFFSTRTSGHMSLLFPTQIQLYLFLAWFSLINHIILFQIKGGLMLEASTDTGLVEGHLLNEKIILFKLLKF